MGKRIGIVDAVFGAFMAIVCVRFMSASPPHGMPVGVAVMLSIVPAIMFGAMFMFSFYIIRAAAMFDDFFDDHGYFGDRTNMRDTFEND